MRTTLDFAAIKRSIGCPSADDILSFIQNLACDERKAEANQVVLEHELQDAQTSVWLPGAEAFLDSAKQHALPLAIVTRNCREATEIKLNNNRIDVEHVITREDAPAKPDPTALLRIAEAWQLSPPDIAYLGDYIYDIQAAHNANMQAWLYQYQSGIEDYKTCLSYVAKV